MIKGTDLAPLKGKLVGVYLVGGQGFNGRLFTWDQNKLVLMLNDRPKIAALEHIAGIEELYE